MNRLLLLQTIFCLFAFHLYSQESINIGNKYSMHSAVLNEERSYWVYLPPEYNNTQYAETRYPVIYLLDGDTNFHTVVAVQKSFTNGMYNYMPECIIVGIPNTDRSRDLTPSNSFLIRNGKKMYSNSGGSKNFNTFLTKELRNTIDSTYRTDTYNILIGHSFGGLFSIYTLLHHPQSFNAYIALDPSLWWDNKKVLEESKIMLKNGTFKGRSLFVAMANDTYRSEDKQKHAETIEEFITTVLPSFPQNGLNYSSNYFESEDHGTVLMPGIYEGLRTIFSGITLPVKEIPLYPEQVQIYYQQLSEKLGHTFIPSEILVDRLGKYSLSINNLQGAIALFEFNLRNYRTSSHALNSLQETYSIQKTRKVNNNL